MSNTETTDKAISLIGLIGKGELCKDLDISIYKLNTCISESDWKLSVALDVVYLYGKNFSV